MLKATESPALSSQLPESLRPASTSVAGATALVAGTTIGAGILALPAKTLEAGFGPSAVLLTAAWAYMAASALLIAEVNVNTVCALERDAVSINTMAKDTIGDVGATASSLAYAFIHYALLVAYMIQGGTLLAELVPALNGASSIGFSSTARFAAVGGGSLLLGTVSQVGKANSALFAGVVGSFLALVAVGATQISPAYLAHTAPAAALPALPVMVLSFTFHNVVPTITYQLGCDMEKIRVAILGGSLIPLLMFLLWNGVVLGSVPFDAAASASLDGSIFDPLEALRAGGDLFGEVVRVFSLLAIITSFIGFCYGLVDFYADLLNLNNDMPASTLASDSAGATTLEAALGDDDGDPYDEPALERPLPIKAGLLSLTLLPPLAIATIDPSLFFSALDNAGTFGILTLFGIIPCLMAWTQRYGPGADPVVPDALPGGKLTLSAMIGLACVFVGIEGAERLATIGGI
jgi:tyrosine-specific transport protein